MGPTIRERLAKLECPRCKEEGALVTRHKDLDSVLSRHLEHKEENDGEEEEVTPLKRRATVTDENVKKKKNTGKNEADPGQGLTKMAKKLLYCPPSEATEESHRWQGLFLEMCIGEMPANNKLDKQEAVFSNAVVTKALNFGRMFKTMCPPSGLNSLGEENDRPRTMGVLAGLVSLVGKENKVQVKNNPVRYYVAKVVNGVEVEIESSPLGHASTFMAEDSTNSIEHGESSSRKWKSDSLVSSEVVMDGELVRIPRILVEAKGDAASACDLYQASSTGFKELLKRLQSGLHVDRLYLEVWGTISYFYGIQDIFGYITIKNGTVTRESFESYEKLVNRRKAFKHFPLDSFSRCPKTIEDFQAAYDQKAREFSRKYHSDLPSLHGQEDFPVGVVYFSKDFRLMPTGRADPSFEELCLFVQGNARILSSNAVVVGDDCNERLVNNYEAFMRRIEQEGLMATLRQPSQLPRIPVTMYRIAKEPMSDSFQLGEMIIRPNDHAQGSSVSSCALGTGNDYLKNPPSKANVGRWTTSDVSDFVRSVSGNCYDEAALMKSWVDGSSLVGLDELERAEWLKSLGLPLQERYKIRNWIVNLKD